MKRLWNMLFSLSLCLSVSIVCVATMLLVETGSLCSYLEDVLAAKRHPASSQTLFCLALIIHSATLFSISVSYIHGGP